MADNQDDVLEGALIGGGEDKIPTSQGGDPPVSSIKGQMEGAAMQTNIPTPDLRDRFDATSDIRRMPETTQAGGEGELSIEEFRARERKKFEQQEQERDAEAPTVEEEEEVLPEIVANRDAFTSTYNFLKKSPKFNMGGASFEEFFDKYSQESNKEQLKSLMRNVSKYQGEDNKVDFDVTTWDSTYSSMFIPKVNEVQNEEAKQSPITQTQPAPPTPILSVSQKALDQLQKLSKESEEKNKNLAVAKDERDSKLAMLQTDKKKGLDEGEYERRRNAIEADYLNKENEAAAITSPEEFSALRVLNPMYKTDAKLRDEVFKDLYRNDENDGYATYEDLSKIDYSKYNNNPEDILYTTKSTVKRFVDDRNYTADNLVWATNTENSLKLQLEEKDYNLTNIEGVELDEYGTPFYFDKRGVRISLDTEEQKKEFLEMELAEVQQSKEHWQKEFDRRARITAIDDKPSVDTEAIEFTQTYSSKVQNALESYMGDRYSEFTESVDMVNAEYEKFLDGEENRYMYFRSRARLLAKNLLTQEQYSEIENEYGRPYVEQGWDFSDRGAEESLKGIRDDMRAGKVGRIGRRTEGWREGDPRLVEEDFVDFYFDALALPRKIEYNEYKNKQRLFEDIDYGVSYEGYKKYEEFINQDFIPKYQKQMEAETKSIVFNLREEIELAKENFKSEVDKKSAEGLKEINNSFESEYDAFAENNEAAKRITDKYQRLINSAKTEDEILKLNSQYNAEMQTVEGFSEIATRHQKAHDEYYNNVVDQENANWVRQVQKLYNDATGKYYKISRDIIGNTYNNKFLKGYNPKKYIDGFSDLIESSMGYAEQKAAVKLLWSNYANMLIKEIKSTEKRVPANNEESQLPWYEWTGRAAKTDEELKNRNKEVALRTGGQARMEFMYSALDELLWDKTSGSPFKEESVYALKSMMEEAFEDLQAITQAYNKEKLELEQQAGVTEGFLTGREVGATKRSDVAEAKRKEAAGEKLYSYDVFVSANERARRQIRDRQDEMFYTKTELAMMARIPSSNKGFWSGVGAGMKGNLHKAIPFLSAMWEIDNGISSITAANKMQEGIPLTQEETAVLNQQALANSLREALPNDWTQTGYNVGEGLDVMFAYIGEYAATYGIAGIPSMAAKKTTINIGKKILTKRLNKVLQKKVGQNVGTLKRIGIADDVLKQMGKAEALAAIEGFGTTGVSKKVMGAFEMLIRSIAQTAANPQMVMNNTIQRLTPEVALALNGNFDDLMVQIESKGEDFLEAFAKGFGMSWAEMVTEQFGHKVFTPAYKAMAKRLGTTEVIKRTLLGGWLRTSGFATKGTAMNQIIKKNIGWDGIINEYLEEFANGRLSALLTGDSGVFDIDGQKELETFLTVAIFGAPTTALRYGKKGISRGFQARVAKTKDKKGVVIFDVEQAGVEGGTTVTIPKPAWKKFNTLLGKDSITMLEGFVESSGNNFTEEQKGLLRNIYAQVNGGNLSQKAKYAEFKEKFEAETNEKVDFTEENTDVVVNNEDGSTNEELSYKAGDQLEIPFGQEQAQPETAKEEGKEEVEGVEAIDVGQTVTLKTPANGTGEVVEDLGDKVKVKVDGRTRTVSKNKTELTEDQEDDKEDETGIPSSEQVDEVTVQTDTDQEGGAEETETGGVVQEEQVTKGKVTFKGKELTEEELIEEYRKEPSSFSLEDFGEYIEHEGVEENKAEAIDRINKKRSPKYTSEGSNKGNYRPSFVEALLNKHFENKKARSLAYYIRKHFDKYFSAEMRGRGSGSGVKYSFAEHMSYILEEVARQAATNPKAVEAFAKDVGIEIPKSYEAAPAQVKAKAATAKTEVTEEGVEEKAEFVEPTQKENKTTLETLRGKKEGKLTADNWRNKSNAIKEFLGKKLTQTQIDEKVKEFRKKMKMGKARAKKPDLGRAITQSLNKNTAEDVYTALTEIFEKTDEATAKARTETRKKIIAENKGRVKVSPAEEAKIKAAEEQQEAAAAPKTTTKETSTPAPKAKETTTGEVTLEEKKKAILRQMPRANVDEMEEDFINEQYEALPDEFKDAKKTTTPPPKTTTKKKAEDKAAEAAVEEEKKKKEKPKEEKKKGTWSETKKDYKKKGWGGVATQMKDDKGNTFTVRTEKEQSNFSLVVTREGYKPVVQNNIATLQEAKATANEISKQTDPTVPKLGAVAEGREKIPTKGGLIVNPLSAWLSKLGGSMNRNVYLSKQDRTIDTSNLNEQEKQQVLEAEQKYNDYFKERNSAEKARNEGKFVVYRKVGDPSSKNRIQPQKPAEESKPISFKEIVGFVQKAFGVTVSENRVVRRGAEKDNFLGKAIPKIRKIFLGDLKNFASKLDVLAHELGHIVSSNLKIDDKVHEERKTNSALTSEIEELNKNSLKMPKKNSLVQTKEAVAEFIRAYAFNAVEAEQRYPEMSKIFNSDQSRDAKKIRENLQKFGNNVGAYLSQSDLQTMEANADIAPTKRRKVAEWSRKFFTGNYWRWNRMDKYGNLITDANIWDNIGQFWVSQFYKLQKQMNFYEELMGADVMAEANPYILARMNLGADNRFADFMLGTGLVDANGRRVIYTDKRDGKSYLVSFDFIVDPINNGNHKRLKQLRVEMQNYMIAQRTLDYVRKMVKTDKNGNPIIENDRFVLNERGEKSETEENEKPTKYIDVNKLTGIMGQVKNATNDYEAAQSIINQYENRWAEDKNNGGNKGEQIKESIKRYRFVADQMLQYLVAKGYMSQEKYQEINATNQHYVAMHRVLERTVGELKQDYKKYLLGRRTTDTKVTIEKAAKGGKTDVKDVFENLMGVLQVGYKSADQNAMMVAYVNVLNEMKDKFGYDLISNKLVETEKIGSNDITVRIDGKKKTFTVDDFAADILRGAKGSYYKLPILLTIMPTILKRAVTGTPAFGLRNLTRDTVNRMIISRNKVSLADYNTTGDFTRADKRRLKELDKKNKLTDEESTEMQALLVKLSNKPMEMLKASGADQTSWYMRDPRSYSNMQRYAMRETIKKKQGAIINAARKASVIVPYSKRWNNALSKTEVASRVVEFNSAYDKSYNRLKKDFTTQYQGILTQEEINNKAHRNALLEAGYEARDLMDFAVAGEHARLINQVIPFFNPMLQGIYRSGKAVAEDSYKGVPMINRVGARLVSMSLITSTIEYTMAMVGGYDDELDAQPAYLKDMFWNFKVAPDFWLRIPKPFEMGMLSSGITRGISFAKGNEKAFEGFGESLNHSFNPFISDKIASAGYGSAILGLIKNQDTFRGKDIVPFYERGLALEYRKPTFSSTFGQYIHELGIGMDAREVDFFINNQFGKWGSLFLDISDNLPRLEKYKKSEKYEDRFVDTSLIRSIADALGVSASSPAAGHRDILWLSEKAEEMGVAKDRKKIQGYKAKVYEKGISKEEKERRIKVMVNWAQKRRKYYEKKIEAGKRVKSSKSQQGMGSMSGMSGMRGM
jgi:hypothetical protein